MANTPKATEGMTTEMVVKLSDDALTGITSFEDALALLTETYGAESVVLASEVLGDGFALLDSKDKHKLVGEMFVIVNWSFHIGENGEYVIARIVTANNRKLVLTDGSTGICKQLSTYSANTGKYAAMVVKQGLRRSDYTFTNEQGEEKSATTYYLDVSA